MHVLFFTVVQHKTAVLVLMADFCSVTAEKLAHKLRADLSEISRVDYVIIGRRCSGGEQVSVYRIVCRTCHSRTHIVRILYAHIGYLAYRDTLYIRRFFSYRGYATACAGSCPLCGRWTNTAVVYRESELPFGRAEV